ncbi:MAG: VOC family protein [Dyadobacter sp.]|uniref:VOC family protein n=1 Tax=Dyadobacter sp. TaxID=1914288 RepID=UPI003263E4C8
MSVETEITIIPFLVVKDALSAIDFYMNAFGATVPEKYTNEGRTMAKISVGNASFWIGDEEPEFNNFSPQTIGGSPVRIVLTTPDPDTIFDKALHSGAIQICPVTVEESWKIGKLQDPYGHTWEIGCPLT